MPGAVVVCVPKGTTLGFKALPSGTTLPSTAAAAVAAEPTEADWAGIYPQLSFAQALAYLPNQFERGYAHASIVRLTAKRDILVVALADPVFTDGAVPSAAKAQRVRDAVCALAARGHDAEDVTVAPLRTDLPLLRACGKRCIALCIPDAETLELALPKRMFTQEWVASEELFAFVESARMPATVGEVVGQRLHRSTLTDLEVLAETLAQQLDETRCTALELAIEQALRGG